VYHVRRALAGRLADKEKGITVKSVLATLLVTCMFLLAAHADSSDIFPLNPGSVKSGSERALGQSKVIRQRKASVDVDGLYSRHNVESIKLQLFDDIELTAIRVKARRTSDGSLIWSGKLAGVEDGQIILVAQSRNIFASIYLPAKTGNGNDLIIYQIRPEEQAISAGGMLSKGAKTSSAASHSPMHVIREIHYGWKTAGGVPDEEGKLIELVNLERAVDGIPVLQFNDKLAAAARRHAQDMAQYDYCSHDRRDGREFWQSIRASGYPTSKLAENVAAGLATPEETFESLMSSPLHWANIIDPEFTQIGVGHAVGPTGVYHHFWAQEFGAGVQR